MNAPVLLAQLSGSTPQATATPKNLKLEKPANGQAVAVHLDGNTKLDFTDISSEKLTFVKVGEKLIVLFDNQSTVTIDPVFDSMGTPLPEIAFLVGQDRTVTGDEFAALFPITTDQSVLPAAGGNGSGPSGGANFSDATVGALDANGNPLALLGDENFGGPQFGVFETGTPQPIFGDADVLNFDDEGLSEGNLDGPGDEPGNATSGTGSLHVDFGTDRAGATFAFTAAQAGLTGLTSGGEVIHLFVGLVGGVPTIIGYVGADQNDLSHQVFTVTIDSNALEGAYTFTLLRPLDHSQHGTEDTLSLTIGFSATDGSGDTGTGTITVNVNDDSPVIIPEQVDQQIPETAYLTLQDPVNGFSERTGTLGISWGADRFNDHPNGGVSATTGQNGDRSVVFTDNAVTVTGHVVSGNGDSPTVTNVTFPALLSHGVEVQFVLSDDGTTLVAYTGDKPDLPINGEVSANIIFIATLSDDSNSGSYTIKQYQELDHKSDNQTFDSLDISLHYTATDSDGDPINGTLTLTINDDEPAITVSDIQNLKVYEDGNVGDTYNTNGDAGVAHVAIGNLGVQWGADNTDGPNDVSGKQDGAHSGSDDNTELTGRALYFTNTDVTANPLTSHGETVLFMLDDSGSTLIGYTGSSENPHTVFTVTLSDNGSGSYTFNLIGVLDHPVENSEDDIALQFNFTARDFDGDTISDSFTVTVNDDAPVQTNAVVTGAVNENDLADFNPAYPVIFDFWQGSLGTSPHDGGTGLLGTVPVSGALSTLVSPGADGPGAFHLISETDATALIASSGLSSHGDAIDHVQSINVPSVGDVMGFFASDGRLVFGLTVDAEGHYNFRLFDQIDHPLTDDPGTSGHETAFADTLNIDLSQYVTYTDFDGDSITLKDGSFSINVTDDVPVVVGHETGTVNENDLADFNPLYPMVFDFWQGSLGTSPFDGFSDDGSITGLLGTVPVYGFLTDNVLGGADEFGKFDLVSEQKAETLLASINDGQPLMSHGDAIDHVEAINIPSLGEAMGFFASDGRLVFGLFVSEGGFYNFRLFDQLDHPLTDNPNTPEHETAFADTLNIDLSKFVTFTDSDGDTIDLGSDTFVISVIDDVPQVIGSLNVTLDESHLNNFTIGWDLIPSAIKALYPVEGSTGTDPGSDTDLLLNTTSQQGFLNEIIGNNVVNGGADDFGKFGLVSVAHANDVLESLTGWSSKGEAIDHVQILDLGALGTVMGFFAGDRIVFTLAVNETGFYDLRLFDQVDHTAANGSNGASINFDLSKFVTYTDFDGDAIDLGTGHLVLTVLDDAPEPVVGAQVIATVEEEHNDLLTVIFGGDQVHGNEDQIGSGDQDGVGLGTSDIVIGSLASLVKTGADENGTFSFNTSIVGTAVHDATGAAITSHGFAVKYAISLGSLVGFADANDNGVLDFGEHRVFSVSLLEVPPAGLLDGKVNDTFTFTLLDQIDHANSNGASTEDSKNIDLSSTIKFTDADGDSTGLGAGSFQIQVIDDTPIQITGKTVKGTVEEEHNAGSQFPEMNHGNEDFGPDPADKDFSFIVSFNNETRNDVTGDLRSLVSVGADEVSQIPLIANYGTFSLGATDGLPTITSKGHSVTYSVTDGNDADTLTATSDDGRVIFTLTITNNGSSSGDYKFTLLDQIDHADGGGENIKTLDLSSVVQFSDADGDTITLTGGSFTIDVIDDVPTTKGNVTSSTLDDEAQGLFTPPNTASVTGDIATNVKTVTGVAGALFSIGADDVGTVTMNAFPALKVIFNDGNGFAGSESVTWGTPPTVGSDGATTWTATSAHYDSEHPAAILTIRMDGSYTFIVNAPVVQDTNSTSENDDLSLKFEYTATDFDKDSVTGSLTVKIDDDTPISKGAVAATVTLDDDVFGGNAGTDTNNDVQDAHIATGGAGALFSAGADGVQSVVLTSQSGVRAIVVDAHGVGTVENLSWTTTTADGATTFTGKTAAGLVAATLTIENDGSYTFTTYMPLAHPNSAAIEENLPLTFNYTVTDGDGDKVTGSLTVQVNDDTPVVKGVLGAVAATVTLDDDVFGGNAGTDTNNDVQDAHIATGGAGSLFTVGADGFKSVTLDSQSGFKAIVKDIHGIATTESVTWTTTVVDGATTFTGKGVDSGQLVATLTIGSDGSYTFTTYVALAHPNSAAIEENLPLTFNYTVTDGDNDKVSGSLTVEINDDTPTVAISQAPLTVDEEGLGGNAGDTYGTPNNHDAATSLASANGTLVYSFGADGASATADIAFSTANLAALGLKSAGQALTYGWDQASHTLTASAGGSPVFTLHVTDPSTGAYTFTQLQPLDHSVTGTEDNITIPFNFTITDGDNDTQGGTVSININDDAPTFTVGNVVNGLVDEEGVNANGNPDAPAPYALSDLTGTDTVATGGLGVSWGADNSNSGSVDRTLAFRSIIETAAVFDSTGAAVKSHGAALHYHLTTIGGFPAVIGYIGSDPNLAANQIFTVTLDDTSATGTYKFTLLQNLDHPVVNSEDDLTINFGFTAKDADGDTVDGSFKVTVDDDSPIIVASLVQNGFVDEEHLPGGNDGDSYPSGDLAAPNDDGDLTASGSLGVRFGVDGPAAITTSPGTPSVFNFNTGNLSVDPNLTINAHFGIVSGAIAGGQNAPIVITATNGHPFELSSVKLSFAGGSTLDSKILVTGIDVNGNTWTELVSVANVTSLNGQTPTTFNTSGTSLDHKLLTQVSFAVYNNAAAYVQVDDLSISRGGGAINDGPITFTDHANFAAAASNVTITDSSGANVNLANLTSHGMQVKFALLDAVTLVAYTGNTPTSIGDNNVVFSTVLSANSPNGSYNFVLKGPLDHPLGGTEDDLVFSFKYTAKDFDGDTSNSTFTVTVDDDAPILAIAPSSNLIVDGTLTGNGGDFLTPAGWSAHAAIDTGGNLDNGVWTYSAAPGGSQVQLERVDSGYRGVTSSNGNPLIDLEATPGNIQISQTLHGLSSGQGVQVSFEIGQAVDGGGTAKLEVFWNNVSVGIFDPPLGAAQTYSVTVTALGGDNVLTFREVGQSGDNTGTYLTNISASNVVIIDETRGVDANSNDVTGIGSLFTGIHGVFGTDSDMDQPQYARGIAALVGITASYGADGPAAGGGTVYALTLGSEGVPSGLTTTEGKPISLFTDGAFILGRYESDGHAGITAADKIAFAFKIDPVTGIVSIAQYVSLDEPDGTNSNDGMSLVSGALSVTVTVTDRDGDSVTKTVDVSDRIVFRDDSPTLTGTPDLGSVTEALLPSILNNQAVHNLKINFGADGASAHLAFERDSNGNPVHPDDITSGGHPLHYAIRVVGAGEEQLVAYREGESVNEPVFIVELTSPPNPNYVFSLYQSLDHTGANGETLPLNFSVVGTDGDGDSVTQHFQVNVTDQGVTVGPAPAAILIDEDARVSSGDHTATVNGLAGALGFGGSDGIAAVVVTGVTAAGLAASQTLHSNGQEVHFGEFEGAFVGYTGSLPITAASVVFSVTVAIDGSYSFTLNQPIDHTGTPGEPVTLTFGVTATDGDTDVGSTSFTIEVDPAGTIGSIEYTNLQTGVFVNLDDASAMVGTQAVAANTATDIDGSSPKIVGIDNVTGIADAFGGSNNDILVGGAESNKLVGNAGNDMIIGRGGNDTLQGDAGNDTFIYNPGNGTAIVGDGSDIIDGGADIDTIQINRLSAEQNRYYVRDTATGFNVTVNHYGIGADDVLTTTSVEKLNVEVKGNEQVVLQGNLTGLSVDVQGNDEGSGLFLNELNAITAVTGNLGGGNDEVYAGNQATGAVVDGGDGVDSLHFELVNAPVNVDLELGTAVRATGTDNFTHFENVTGTSYNDVLLGSSANNEINGGDGSDVIVGRGGADVLNGGAGNDRIIGGDELIANGGFKGPAEVMLPIGSTGSTDLGGGWTVTDGTVDLLFVPGTLGTNFPAGVNAVDMRGVSNGTIAQSFATVIGQTYTVTFLQATNPDILSNTTDKSSSVTVSATGGVEETYVHNIAEGTAWGSVGQTFVERTYTFTATAAMTTLTFESDGGAAPQYYGSLIAEVFVESAASADVGDTIHGGTGNDVIHGGAGADIIDGDEDNDLILGGEGADTIRGGTGNDFLSGGAGNDNLSGGDGDDVISYSVGDGSDVVHGGADNDQLFVHGNESNNTFAITNGDIDPTTLEVTVDGVTSHVDGVEDISILGGGGNDILTVAGDFTGTGLATSTIHFDAGAGNDTLNLSGQISAHRVVSDGGAGTDTVAFGFAYPGADHVTKVFDSSGHLIGANITYTLDGHEVTSTFTNYENFQFTDGPARTLDQLFNTPPVAGDDALTASEDTPVTFTAAMLTTNDSDVDGNALTITSVSGATHGAVSLDVNGDVVFTPVANFSGTAEFDYTISDGQGGTDTGHATINVAPVADAPVFTIDTGRPVSAEIDVSDPIDNNFGDYEPKIAALNDGGFVVTWYSYRDSEADVYTRAYDADGTARGAEQNVSNPAGNDAGGYQPAITTLTDGGYVVTWYAYRDGDGDVYTRAYDANGTPRGAAQNISDVTDNDVDDYQSSIMALPDGGYAVTWLTSGDGDSDVYTRTYDANGTPRGAEQNVSVHGINDYQATMTALNDGGYVVAWHTANDGDIYTRTYNADGTPRAPAQDVSDPVNNHSPDLAAAITTLTDGSYVVAWNSYRDGDSDVFTRAYNADGTPKGAEQNVSDPTNNGKFDEQPSITALTDGGYVVAWQKTDGDHDVYVRAYNADGTPREAAQNVSDPTDNGVDDWAPVVTALAGGGYVVSWYSSHGGDSDPDIYAKVFGATPGTGKEDTAITLPVIAASVTDADSETLALTISGIPVGATITDGISGHTFTATSLLTSFDVTGWTLTALKITPPANFNGDFTLSVNATVTDTAHYADGSTQTDTNTWSQATTVHVTPVNDAPIAVNDSYTTNEDTPLTIGALLGLLNNDTDVDTGATRTAALVSGPTHGSLTLNLDGSFSYTPDANYNGTDSFSYKANDGAANSNTATVNLTVTAVNDAPVIDSYSGAESVSRTFDENGTGQVAAVHATDAENQSISYTLAGDDALKFSVDTNGVLTFNNSPDFENPTDANHDNHYKVTVVASDGSLTDSQSFDVEVKDLVENHAPAAVGETIYVNYDASRADVNVPSRWDPHGDASHFSIPVTALLWNDKDTDGDALSIASVTGNGSAAGKVSLSSDGQYVLFPYQTDATFSYTVSDGHGGTQTATATIHVGLPSDVSGDNFLIDMSLGGANFLGGTGHDILIANNGTGTNVFGDSQANPDTFTSGSGNDLIIGSDQSVGDKLFGGKGDDTIYGRAGNDELYGDVGNDTLVGGVGSDTLAGGTGSDTFKYLLGDMTGGGADTINDFQTGQNGDTIDLSGLLSNLSASAREGAVRFHYSDGSDHLLSNDAAAPINVDGTAVALQVNLNDGGGWKTVANIVDTGTNLSGGSEVINMMLNAGQAAHQYHV